MEVIQEGALDRGNTCASANLVRQSLPVFVTIHSMSALADFAPAHYAFRQRTMQIEPIGINHRSAYSC
jgi:hypothetical protein